MLFSGFCRSAQVSSIDYGDRSRQGSMWVRKSGFHTGWVMREFESEENDPNVITEWLASELWARFLADGPCKVSSLSFERTQLTRSRS